jgi:ABC-2 type transport system ATP-binding protein
VDNIISINSLNKTYKVSKRAKSGLSSAFKSLFAKDFKNVEALKDVTLNVKEGEIRGLIGPNGAGKSTLIKVISGILYPSSGEVNVMGFVPWLDRERYVKNIGVLFGQKSQLWWDLPPIDTFALHKKLYSIPENTFKNNVEYFIELLKIDEVVTKPVRQLSLGERMKCEFVCALLHEPKLVYLDEPTIGLDILAKASIRQFIKNVNKEKGTTFIITTHDISDIENLCSEVCIINKGQKVYDDTLQSLKSFFANKKTITVTLSEQVDKSSLQGFNVIEAKPACIKIEVDLDIKHLKDEIYKVLELLPVNDININSIGIEEVIKQIYVS